MLLHTIGKYGEAGAPDPFTDKYIFPGYHVPSLSQMVSASEKVRLIASDVEMLRLHYAYTLRHWLERATKARDEIVAMYDERFFRMWEFYLAGGIVAFENGAMNNYQIQYIRDRRALPITRDYMVEAEAAHCGRSTPRIEKARRSCSRAFAASQVEEDRLAGLRRAALLDHLAVHLPALFRRDAAVAVGVGHVEVADRGVGRFLQRHAAVLVGVGHLEHVAAHLLPPIGACHAAGLRRRAGNGRLAVLQLDAALDAHLVALGEFVAADRPVLVGVEPVEGRAGIARASGVRRRARRASGGNAPSSPRGRPRPLPWSRKPSRLVSSCAKCSRTLATTSSRVCTRSMPIGGIGATCGAGAAGDRGLGKRRRRQGRCRRRRSEIPS